MNNINGRDELRSYTSTDEPHASQKIDLRGMWLVVVAVAWMAGIILDRWLLISSLFLLIGACAALIGLLVFWRDQRGRVLLLFVLWLLLGAWRYGMASPVGDPHAVASFIGSGKIEIQGSVAAEPTEESRSRILLIATSSISTDGGTTYQDVHGDIEVQILGSNLANPYGPNYGDSVQLQGKLQQPGANSVPDVQASMAFPRISVNSTGGNPLLEAIGQMRITLATIITQSLPQPEAALLIAILLGMHTPPLKPLLPIFNETGTAHLLAPSGFKVTLMAGWIVAGTRWLYEKQSGVPMGVVNTQGTRVRGRHWIGTILAICAIIGYTLLSGASPAALRAGFMGILLVIAPRLGRRYNVYTALAAAAIIMSMIDPLVLWDVSFLLSFLGTLGIVFLEPFFQRLLSPLDRIPFGHILNEIIAVTLAAQVATLPIAALTFNQISFIAPLANILTVPLLGMLLLLGVLICAVGLISIPAAVIAGWMALPLLRYTNEILAWCALRPYAYLNVNNLSWPLTWVYYGLQALIARTLFYWRPRFLLSAKHNTSQTHFSRRILLIVQLAVAVFFLLATGTAAMANRPDEQLTITFLSVGPAGQPPQGEAVLIHTPDGKYALIDGGLDPTSLGKELDSRLPSWQRTLNAVILTSPRTDHMTGLQDVITRYQVNNTLDAGMLHPNVGYALWQHTINERSIPYAQIRQGMTINVGADVALQVFWPPAQLHKASSEEIDNGLIVRLIAPGLRILFLGAASMSKYALDGLLTQINPAYLQSDIVQLVGVSGKNFPSQLSEVLVAAHPSLLIVSPQALSGKQHKTVSTTVLYPLPSALAGSSWQVVQTAQAGTIEVDDTGQGWGVQALT